MSYATLTLTIVLFLNIAMFLTAETASNSPMLGIIKGIVTGNFDIQWSSIFSRTKLTQLGIILGLVTVVSILMSPASLLTGNFATVHALTIIGIASFMFFSAIPNFSMMGIPEPLSSLLSIFIGFLVTLSIIGFLKGE